MELNNENTKQLSNQTMNQSPSQFFQEFIKYNFVKSVKLTKFKKDILTNELNDNVTKVTIKKTSRGDKICLSFKDENKTKYAMFKFEKQKTNLNIESEKIINGIKIKTVSPKIKIIEFTEIEQYHIIENFIQNLKPEEEIIEIIDEEEIIEIIDEPEIIEEVLEEESVPLPLPVEFIIVPDKLEEYHGVDEKSQKISNFKYETKIKEYVNWIRGYYRYNKYKYKNMTLSKCNKNKLMNLVSFHNIDLEIGKKYHDLFNSTIIKFDEFNKNNDIDAMMVEYVIIRKFFPSYDMCNEKNKENLEKIKVLIKEELLQTKRQRIDNEVNDVEDIKEVVEVEDIKEVVEVEVEVVEEVVEEIDDSDEESESDIEEDEEDPFDYKDNLNNILDYTYELFETSINKKEQFDKLFPTIEDILSNLNFKKRLPYDVEVNLIEMIQTISDDLKYKINYIEKLGKLEEINRKYLIKNT
jgi:hypothetical protein